MSPKIGSTEEAMTVAKECGCSDELGLTPGDVQDTQEQKERPKMIIVWPNVILFIILHLAALYGFTLCFNAKISSIVFGVIYHQISGVGITAGAHRLWAHRAYKAKLPLRILLSLMNSAAFQNDIIEWARDHRVHHKYSETDSDPHNACRGFFFAHIGWLLVRKHPDVKTNGKKLDISDLIADPVLRIQRRLYIPSVILLCFIVPAVIPYYFWGETFWNAFFICSVFRYCMVLNSTWLVNSAAHMWGHRPYDTTINPRQNFGVVILAAGEGFHNYHHVFPQDYSTSEWGKLFNLTTTFIDFMAYIGQAYDLKKIPKEYIEKRKTKTGDKAHSC